MTTSFNIIYMLLLMIKTDLIQTVKMNELFSPLYWLNRSFLRHAYMTTSYNIIYVVINDQTIIK